MAANWLRPLVFTRLHCLNGRMAKDKSRRLVMELCDYFATSEWFKNSIKKRINFQSLRRLSDSYLWLILTTSCRRFEKHWKGRKISGLIQKNCRCLAILN